MLKIIARHKPSKYTSKYKGEQMKNNTLTPLSRGGGHTPSLSSKTLEISSKDAYVDKYAKGYGICYPEGHVIRFYQRICLYSLGLKGGRILDFGCGNGVHAQYFQERGFEVYGVDIISQAIDLAKAQIGDRARLISPNQSLKNLFIDKNSAPLSFDMIFANQSLYYLNNTHLRRQVDEFYEMSSKGGICFFTMMSRQNGYNKCITKVLDNGLSEVSLKGRLEEVSYIRFVDSTDELKEIFAPFKPLYIGEYNSFELYEPYSCEGSSHHYIFIGQKE